MSATSSIEWTEVPGWPGIAASRDGRVRGRSGRVLKPYATNTGHRYVLIPQPGGRGTPGRKLWLHHAVLLAFVGPRPEGQEGRHLDDDSGNNAVENLAWGTRSENIADRLRNGRHLVGEASPSAVLTSGAVAAIRRDPRSSRAVGAAYGVSHTTVQKIRRGEKWRAA